MNKELIRSISDIFTGLRPLIISQLVKPLKEIEKSAYPHGYINVMHCILSKGSEPVSMTDLAGLACVAKPNLTTIVDRLLEEGLVERSPDPNDRRIVNIILTKGGLEVLNNQHMEFRQFMEEKISSLEEEDLLKLKMALEDIASVLGKIDQPRSL